MYCNEVGTLLKELAVTANDDDFCINKALNSLMPSSRERSKFFNDVEVNLNDVHLANGLNAEL